MGQWVSHQAFMDDAILPQDNYCHRIVFGTGFFKPGEYLEVAADKNWLIPLISGQEVEISFETDVELRINGSLIIYGV